MNAGSTRAATRAVRLAVAAVIAAASTVVLAPPSAGAAPTPLGTIAGAGYGGSPRSGVFRDYNADGVWADGEPGQAGIEVSAVCVDDDGTLPTSLDDTYVTAGPVTTAADGSYTLTGANVRGACRVEFAIPSTMSSFLQPGAATASAVSPNSAGSFVQFVEIASAGATVNVTTSVNNPADYSTPDLSPRVAVGRQRTGDPADNSDTLGTLYTIDYDSTGQATGDNPTQPGVNQIAAAPQTGATWGIAYDAGSGLLFTSAVLKRHSGMGPGGADAIYAANGDGTPVGGVWATPFTAVDTDAGAVLSNTDRGLDVFNTPSHDVAAFSQVGKVSWGDLDISEDGSTLYAVNLMNKTLQAIDVATKTAGPAVPIPTPACTNGQSRPWGLEVDDGVVYVGVVCDASGPGGTTANLAAFVYAYNPTAGALPLAGSPSGLAAGSWSGNLVGDLITGVPLNYIRGCAMAGSGCQWNPWKDTSTEGNISTWGLTLPQPMLTDLEIDDDGSLLLAFSDRMGQQYAYRNYYPEVGNTDTVEVVIAGEILRASPPSGAGTFTLENDGVVERGEALGGGTMTGNTTNNQGPGGGEFYAHERFGSGGSEHQETSLGALGLVAGRGEFLLGAMDPLDTDSGGVMWQPSNGAAPTHRLEMYDTTGLNASGFGKGSGLTDIEIMLDLAPVEIGNRVWSDENSNGTQDPGEPPLPGVEVQLIIGATTYSAITDAGGNYLFSSVDRPDAGGSVTTAPLLAPANYRGAAGDDLATIRVPNVNGASKQAALGALVPTDPNVGTANDVDSDGVVTGTSSEVTFSLGSLDGSAAGTNDANTEAGDGVEREGRNRHVFDFGFSPATYSLGNQLWFDIGAGAEFNNGVFDPSESPAIGVLVELLDGAGNPTGATAVTDGSGYYRFDDLAFADYRVRVAASNFQVGGPLHQFQSSTGSTPGFAAGSNQTDHGIDDPAPATNGITSATIPAAALTTTGDGEAGAPGAGGPNPAFGDAFDNRTVDFGFVRLIDLTLAKTLNPGGPYFAGAPVSYTLVVHNNGPSTAMTGFTVTDRLPAGMTFASPATTSASWTCAAPVLDPAGDQITCTYSGAELTPALDSLPLVLAATVDTPAVPGDFENVAYVAPSPSDVPETIPVGSPDPFENGDPVPTTGDPSNNDDSAALQLAVYDLALAKVGELNPVGEPEGIYYTVTVQNQGNVPSGEYTVVDTLPDGVTLIDGTITGDGEYDADTRTITWTGVDMAPGAPVAEFEFAVTITDVNERPFRNYAEITEDSAQELYGTPTSPVTDIDSDPDVTLTTDEQYDTPDVDNLSIEDAGDPPDPTDDEDIADVDLDLTNAYDLALAKTVNAAVAEPGGAPIEFTVTVLNQGFVNSQGFTVVDNVPEGLEPVLPIMDGTYDPATRTITWAIAPADGLDPGDRIDLTFEATITDITLRPYRNHAEISDDDSDFYNVDGDVIEDEDSVPDTDPDNDGDYDVTDVDNDDIGEAGGDPDPEDDADIADVTVNIEYDLALIKTGPPTIDPTGNVEFTITVINQGNVPSGLYDVTDYVPAGMAFVSADPVAVDDGAGQVVWTGLESLAPGATRELRVTFAIADLTQRPFRNIAEISDDSAEDYDSDGDPPITDPDSDPDDDPTNDTGDLEDGYDTPGVDNDSPDDAGTGEDPEDDADIAVVSAEIVYDMELVKTVTGGPVSQGSAATYTITVFNNGNVPSGPVTVVDTLPAGLTAGAISNGGTLNPDSTITWVVELGPGAQIALTVEVTVSDITQRPFRNVADIVEDGADLYDQPVEGGDVEDIDSIPNDPETSPVDNTSIDEAGDGDDDGFDDEDPAVLDGDVDYDLALIKRLPGGQRFKLGDVIRFEVLVANQGDVASGVYTVQDVLPAGLSFVSASDGGTGASGVVTWAGLPSLAPGEQKLLTVEVRMDDISQSSYINNAEITDDSSETYSAPGDPVTDRDSTPDGDTNNDGYVDTDDISASPVGDEDDHDRALLDTAQVAVDNLSPVPPTQPTSPPATVPTPEELPATGGNSSNTAVIAGGMLLAGIALLLVRRRASRRTA